MKDGLVEDHYDSGGNWDLKLRRTMFRGGEVQQLQDLNEILQSIELEDEEDTWQWNLSKNVRNDLCFREGGLADQKPVNKVKGCIWVWLNMERNCNTLKETLTYGDLRCKWVQLFQA
ncbi:hypothetical protein FRX31_032264 [Thalictrum thalictroides]|uniref:Uncharacterized protein n=1 Tax=Thalictrum thalictroides TaxID=46969 RepID=A0A7J6UZT8_THATH|nr:hypothetical protein FRX31_032264 [Thalictrum thalictroides]